MRTAIGVAVTSRSCTVAVVRGGATLYTATCEIEPAEGPGQAIRRLLATIPRRRWRSLRVRVALGPGHTQLKCLTGLPELGDAEALSAVVRHGVSRFFRGDPDAVLTTGVRIVRSDVVIAAAVDADVVKALERGCAEAGHRLEAVCPAAVALARTLEHGAIRVVDGGLACDATFEEREIVGARTYRRIGGEADSREVSEAPVSGTDPLLGQAAGAASLEAAQPLCHWVDRRHGARSAFRRRWQVPAAAAVLSVMAALVVPAASALLRQWRAEQELALVAEKALPVFETKAELARLISSLEGVQRFVDQRTPILPLLDEISRALPGGAALSRIRFDSGGVTMEALADRVVTVADSLSRLSRFGPAAIRGSITRVHVGGIQLERAELQLPLRRAASVTSDGAP